MKKGTIVWDKAVMYSSKVPKLSGIGDEWPSPAGDQRAVLAQALHHAHPLELGDLVVKVRHLGLLGRLQVVPLAPQPLAGGSLRTRIRSEIETEGPFRVNAHTSHGGGGDSTSGGVHVVKTPLTSLRLKESSRSWKVGS
jgi:hypothetical protein